MRVDPHKTLVDVVEHLAGGVTVILNSDADESAVYSSVRVVDVTDGWTPQTPPGKRDSESNR